MPSSNKEAKGREPRGDTESRDEKDSKSDTKSRHDKEPRDNNQSRRGNESRDKGPTNKEEPREGDHVIYHPVGGAQQTTSAGVVKRVITDPEVFEQRRKENELSLLLMMFSLNNTHILCLSLFPFIFSCLFLPFSLARPLSQ